MGSVLASSNCLKCQFADIVCSLEVLCISNILFARFVFLSVRVRDQHSLRKYATATKHNEHRAPTGAVAVKP